MQRRPRRAHGIHCAHSVRLLFLVVALLVALATAAEVEEKEGGADSGSGSGITTEEDAIAFMEEMFGSMSSEDKKELAKMDRANEENQLLPLPDLTVPIPEPKVKAKPGTVPAQAEGDTPTPAPPPAETSAETVSPDISKAFDNLRNAAELIKNAAATTSPQPELPVHADPMA